MNRGACTHLLESSDGDHQLRPRVLLREEPDCLGGVLQGEGPFDGRGDPAALDELPQRIEVLVAGFRRVDPQALTDEGRERSARR